MVSWTTECVYQLTYQMALCIWLAASDCVSLRGHICTAASLCNHQAFISQLGDSSPFWINLMFKLYSNYITRTLLLLTNTRWLCHWGLNPTNIFHWGCQGLKRCPSNQYRLYFPLHPSPSVTDVALGGKEGGRWETTLEERLRGREEGVEVGEDNDPRVSWIDGKN